MEGRMSSTLWIGCVLMMCGIATTRARTTPGNASELRYVSSCTATTVQCPEKDWTVYVTKVYSGRKLNSSCTTDQQGCCTSTRDQNTECLSENRILVGFQRDYCLNNPGQPCSIFAHSSQPIGCPGGLLSQFSLVEYYCTYVPLPTTEGQSTSTTVGMTTEASTTNAVTTTSSATTKPQIGVTTPRKPTTTVADIKIGTVARPKTTKAPMRYYVSTCRSITVECPQKDWTVYVTKVYGARKLNSSCTSDKEECCTWSRDEDTECMVENRVLLSSQRGYCLDRPGQPCLIFDHSSQDIGCPGQLLSQFSIIEFYCTYVPIPTTTPAPSTTTVRETSPAASTTPAVTQSTPTSGESNTSTPKPLPIAIIAGSAGGGVFLIVIIVIIVCCTRMRKQSIMKDMTKPDFSLAPVSDVGVNYMSGEKGAPDPDIIKTAPKMAYQNPYMFS